MAINMVPGVLPVCKGAADAYFSGACTLDLLQLDAERISETAYALATSEAFSSNAQASFYALGKLAEQLQETAKTESDKFTALSRKHKGEPA